ncbi:MAG: undecaprenyl-diphosphate phosphatase [Oscillospiraceae bacterium]|nr:undecaprenyl-diphosphate phosphatase [Oscillospiraceae bacterium]
MVYIIKAIIIAIIEGITEFLPISSTGHMIIAQNLLNFNGDFETLFIIVIQLGAIMAIVVLYFNKLLDNFKGLFKGDNKKIVFWLNLIIGTIPAVILGLLFSDKIESLLKNVKGVALALIVGGIIIIIIENKFAKRKNLTKDVNDLKIRQALGIGIFQCLALWPGMSRSASTIMGGWIMGASTPAAAEFSFFLAIPAMLGASVLKIVKYDVPFTNLNLITLCIGFIVSFVVALVVVDRFVAYLKRKPMRIFAVYRIALGVLVFVLGYFRIIS